MRECARTTLMLFKHFFRRFFDNDTTQTEGDTLISVVRAACAVAVPGLMYAFFLQLAYPPKPPRPQWGRIEDEYFFVLFSFVSMGLVCVFEWEMLFPDRIDFLILTPLPLKSAQMLAAKASALLAFFSIFLFSGNVFGTGILPLLSPGFPFRQMYAHAVAGLCAGVCAALFFLAIGGLLLCLLGAARVRLVSPLLQMLSVAVLVLLFLHYAKYVETLPALLASPHGWVRWIPPFWFLGMYEQLFHGKAAPSFAAPFTQYAIRATFIDGAIMLLTYPTAWAKMRKLAIEGGSRQPGPPSRRLDGLVHAVIRPPAERAVFHFIGQTIARSNRYQVYLSMYCGTGLALAVACAVTFRPAAGKLVPALSSRGMHAVMPLLLFWATGGLRTAFTFPQALSAGWIFRVPGVPMNNAANAARKWALACSLCLTMIIVTVFAATQAGWQLLLVQAVCGISLSILLTDGAFIFMQSVPFSQPRLPGKTSLPIVLTMYVGILPLFVEAVIAVERQIESHLPRLAFLTVGTALLHAGLTAWRGGSNEIAEDIEGYEGEFQVLGLAEIGKGPLTQATL